MVWIGRDLQTHPVPHPAIGSDTFHLTRLFFAPGLEHFQEFHFRNALCQSWSRSPYKGIKNLSSGITIFFLIQKIWCSSPLKQKKMKLWKHLSCLRCEIAFLCCMLRKSPLAWSSLIPRRKGSLQYPGCLGSLYIISQVLVFALLQTLSVTHMHMPLILASLPCLQSTIISLVGVMS